MLSKYGQWTLNNEVSWKIFPGEKMDDKNHFAAKLKLTRITTERHWDTNQNCWSGVLDFLGRQEIVEIEI